MVDLGAFGGAVALVRDLGAVRAPALVPV
ncbi:hypothetical protein GA0115252_15961, partial [Streptomyces sp. DfronAA-171]